MLLCANWSDRARCTVVRFVIKVIYLQPHRVRVSDEMVLNTDSHEVRDEVEQGEVFFDERQNEHYTVVAVGKNGITLTRENREYYIPHSIFARWYTSSEIERTENRSNTVPE